MFKRILPLLFLICLSTGWGQTCPTMTMPRNGDSDVPVNTLISWTPVDGALGYFLLVGTTLGGRDIVDRVDVGSATMYQLPDDYPPDTVISVKITMYFSEGPDRTCNSENFTTGDADSTEDCGHIINEVPDFFTCDIANDGVENFNIDLASLESQLLGGQSGLTLSYFYPGGEPLDFENPDNQTTVNQRTIWVRATDADGCFKQTEFDLILVATPSVDRLPNVTDCEDFVLPELSSGNDYYTAAGGQGVLLAQGGTLTESQTVYIYAGTDQCSDESRFEVTIDPQLCETPLPEEPIVLPVIEEVIDFPTFFTPNGDGVNDLWPLLGSATEGEIRVGQVSIFDRYGNLLVVLDPESAGWDGTSKGRSMPSSDYWFRAVTVDKTEIKGHFTLKR